MASVIPDIILSFSQILTPYVREVVVVPPSAVLVSEVNRSKSSTSEYGLQNKVMAYDFEIHFASVDFHGHVVSE